MFGYLTARQDLLTEEQLKRYKACYCGLCHSLGERWGGLTRLTLNYDMTFLVLFLGSLYEPEEEQAEFTCLRHPFQKQSVLHSEFSDYAADMNLALSYLKCRDNWEDDGSPLALTASAALKQSFTRARDRWPRQVAAMEASIRMLTSIEEAGLCEPDAAADTFGLLMAEVLVFREDRWASAVREFGRSLGRFIYLCDACLDREQDLARGRYNPFRDLSLPGNPEEFFRSILKMTLGDCVRAFDLLPLVQDVGILKNILCFGLWARFDEQFKDKVGSNDGSGSV